MESNHLLFNIFLIFTGAAILSTIVLYTRQSLLVAYMLLGILLGPWGLKLLPDVHMAEQIGDVGIIFLLFLLGVDLDPRELWSMLREISWIAFISSIVFLGIGILVSLAFGFRYEESFIIGSALMFSSTIIGLKLLPSTTLHHQRIGEIMVSILLMQDLIAIMVMLIFHSIQTPSPYWQDLGFALITLPSLLLIGFLVERYVLRKLLTQFDRVQEYIFLIAIAWCLGMAKLSDYFGLPQEIGAFIAGVAIAEGPIARYIADNLRPIRDFCLVMFFFAIGAQFNINILPEIIWPALVLTGIMMLLKPWLFKLLLKKSGEGDSVSQEAGIRLGQSSEFALILGGMAYQIIPDIFSSRANYLIEACTMLTFIISCYWVVLKYPTPMAMSNKLRRD